MIVYATSKLLSQFSSGSVQVRFVLMNSFSTSDDTKSFLGKSHGDLMSESNVELLQNKSPKVDAKTMAPAEWSQDPDLEWCCPPDLLC